MARLCTVAGLALLAALTLGACERDHPVAVERITSQRIEVDLSALRFAPGDERRQQLCGTVVDQAVLRVDGSEWDRRAVPPELLSVTFDSVEVDVGTVRFAVEVLSNTEETIYAGSVERQVTGDGFRVQVTPEAQGGVLQVCPLQLDLTAETDYTGQLLLRNVGNETLLAEVVLPDETCDGEPCLSIEGGEAELPPEGSATVSLFSNTLDSRTLAVRVDSESGYVDVEVRTGGDAPPRFTTEPVTDGRVDEAYAYTAEAEDPEGAALELAAPTLPSWLSFTDGGDGTGLLAGTPSEAGSFDVVLEASDGRSTTPQAFTITVAAIPFTANDDAAVTNEEEGVIVDVLANDETTDARGPTIVAVTQPRLGRVSSASGNTLLYVPYADSAGADVFTYVAEVGGTRDTADVFVNVNPCVDFDLWTSVDGSEPDVPLQTSEHGETTRPTYFDDGSGEPFYGELYLEGGSLVGRPGQLLGTADVNVVFEFFETGTDVHYVRFTYYDYSSSGGDDTVENVALNDMEPLVATAIDASKLAAASGMEVAVTPGQPGDLYTPATVTVRSAAADPIGRLLVGGYDLLVDDVCYGTEGPTP